MKYERVRILNQAEYLGGPVIYWMSRDQRMRQNWALIYAQRKAMETRSPLIVLFCLADKFLNATARQYGFMLRGLKELSESLSERNIGFRLIIGDPSKSVVKTCDEFEAGILITDFDPLKIKRGWKAEALKGLKIPVYEVDAHNIIPCWYSSVKQEYSARTLRLKYDKLLYDFMDKFPPLREHPFGRAVIDEINPDTIIGEMKIDKSVTEIEWLKPGEKAASRHSKSFIRNRLKWYSELKNDPNSDGQSDLSPFMHFGQISAQKIALDVIKSDAPKKDKEEFLEQLVIRRELADNYCYYNSDYDNIKGFPEWAIKTLDMHSKDKREYKYSLKQFENCGTHDALWNAAQRQMAITGKMHGYLRMYWAKKILEWTTEPSEAQKIAVYLNDKYELDGRDPNGYANIAWSIGGVHDRPWPERNIFGTIRYMNESGCRRKFNVEEYVSRWS